MSISPRERVRGLIGDTRREKEEYETGRKKKKKSSRVSG
jgi:hypothetical protein